VENVKRNNEFGSCMICYQKNCAYCGQSFFVRNLCFETSQFFEFD